MERLREDVERLAGMVRATAGPGEQASAAWVAGRLREAGAVDVVVEPYRGLRTFAWAHGVFAALGLAGLRLARGGGAGRRMAGASLAGAALAGLDLDFSGAARVLGRVLPQGEGANVTARLPTPDPVRRRLVVLAHHDAARTGLIFHPALGRVGWRRRVRRRRVDGLVWPFAAALGLAVLGALGVRPAARAARALLLVTVAAEIDVGTSRTVPGANDNASGVAAVLELARRWAEHPLPATEALVCVPGGEEAGMDGFRAWLGAHAGGLDPARTLVVGLDTVGSGTPVVAAGETAVLVRRYRDADLVLAEAAAARAGLPHPERWILGAWTDPMLARMRGLPALSVLAVDEHGAFPHYHQPDDVAEHVDFASVRAAVELVAAIGEAFAEA